MKCQIETTNFCNFNCKGCLRQTMTRPMGFISMRTFYAALKLCDELNVTDVWLHNWGEPLLHPNIIRLIEIAKNSFKVGFTTNGAYLTGYIMSMLADLRLDYLDISVNKNTPKKLLSSIFAMYDLGNKWKIDTSLRSVIFSTNEFYEIQNIVGQDRKVKWQRGMINNKDVHRTSDCPMIDKIFIVNWDGTVVPCCQAADNEIIYTRIPCNDAATKVKKGIAKIHKSLPIYCRTCKEIECDIPVIYKLGNEYTSN